MIIEDERTEQEKKTYNILISASRRYRGIYAKDQKSCKFGWACENIKHANKVFKWVKNRPDMKLVKIHLNKVWSPKTNDVVSIFKVNKYHPAV